MSAQTEIQALSRRSRPLATAPPAGRGRLATLLLGGLVVLGCCVAMSLMVTSTRVLAPMVAWDAVWGKSNAQLVATVRAIYLPRTVVAILVGASLAVAGALVQGITRNPIVEPSILGINSGAALAVAAATYVGGTTLALGPTTLMPFVAFAGAAAAVGLVYALVSGIDATPGRVALAGVTVALLANAFVSATVLLKVSAVYVLLHYLVGGLANTTWSDSATLLPYVAIGLLASMLIARPVTVLELGDDVARSLGQRVGLVRVVAVAFVVVLAGASVSVAGPIAMVGLVVPHVARWLVGRDYRQVIPLSVVLGSSLVVAADVAARVVVPLTETPVGVLTALLGTPYFIFLARRSRSLV